MRLTDLSAKYLLENITKKSDKDCPDCFSNLVLTKISKNLF